MKWCLQQSFYEKIIDELICRKLTTTPTLFLKPSAHFTRKLCLFLKVRAGHVLLFTDGDYVFWAK